MPCSCCSYEAVFDDKQARKDARRYRNKGLDKAAARLVAHLTGRGVRGDSVLEVGGGVGAIQLELLKAGAARATNIELSAAYDETAAELIADARVGGEVERRVGDFVEAAAELPPADDVVLHRVVCCYPDVDALVGAAAQHAQRTLVLTYPPDSALAHLVVKVFNVVMRLRGSEFRTYVWPVAAIARAAEGQGLRRVAEARASFAWRWAAFER